MRLKIAFFIALSALGLAGCGAHDSREWMKVSQGYTTQQFQRDHRECSRRGDLDEACMRQRGWVPVNPTKAETPKPPDPLQQRGGRY